MGSTSRNDSSPNLGGNPLDRGGPFRLGSYTKAAFVAAERFGQPPPFVINGIMTAAQVAFLVAALKPEKTEEEKQEEKKKVKFRPLSDEVMRALVAKHDSDAKLAWER